jgi:hypothetical protein
MTCPHCNAAITESDFNCPSCNKLTARTREDLNRIDTKSAKGISWAMVGMGLAGFAFVIANSGTEWFSGLDFVAPTAILVAGIGGLMWVRSRG